MIEYVWRNGRRIEVQTLPDPPQLAAKLRKQERRKREAFAIVPLWWAARAGEDGGLIDLLVCIDLLHRAWKAKGKSFVFPTRKGCRRSKPRVLRGLEKASLIRVEWRRGRSPIITMIE